MAKDKSEKKDKKERKEKKEKRAEVDGVKKIKKEKKSKDVVKALEAELEQSSSPEPAQQVKVDPSGDVKMEDDLDGVEPSGALVPFANPLILDAKDLKKVLRTVKKSAKSKTLRRGVKEVVKALRKSETSDPASSNISNPSAITIIAADISPMDVISHIPVLCEDHNIPYLYVKSRAELGEASATKRPTSVVMVSKDRGGKKGKDVKDSDIEDFQEAYKELVKVAIKAAKGLKK